jgi:hypothetical protein
LVSGVCVRCAYATGFLAGFIFLKYRPKPKPLTTTRIKKKCACRNKIEKKTLGKAAQSKVEGHF